MPDLRSRDHAVTGFDDPLVPTPHHLDTSRERCAVSSKESLRNMLMRFRQNIPRGECRSIGGGISIGCGDQQNSVSEYLLHHRPHSLVFLVTPYPDHQ